LIMPIAPPNRNVWRFLELHFRNWIYITNLRAESERAKDVQKKVGTLS